MVYIFAGQDSLSKDIQLKKIRQEFIPRHLEQFNLDVLHARELRLRDLQEAFLRLPLETNKRVIVIKDAQNLKEEAKEFLLGCLQKMPPQIILILDIEHLDHKDEFINSIYRYVKILRFKESVPVDTFTLSRQINLKKPDYALRILNQLLREGERPERILGGLRYVWEKDVTSPQEARRRLRFLLDCDLDIKTGRLKPLYALEKLVIKLCSAGKPFG